MPSDDVCAGTKQAHPTEPHHFPKVHSTSGVSGLHGECLVAPGLGLKHVSRNPSSEGLLLYQKRQWASWRFYFQFSAGGPNTLPGIMPDPLLADKLRAALFSSSVLVLALHTKNCFTR